MLFRSNAKKVGENAAEELAKELAKRLKATGIPVERASSSTAAPEGTLAVQGSFLAVKEGEKTERVAIGMGTGSAQVKTRVDVNYQQSSGPVVFSQFRTDTTLARNLGIAETAPAGVNPAAVAARATVGDRRKNVAAYSQQTADAISKQLMQSMAGMGWIAAKSK